MDKLDYVNISTRSESYERVNDEFTKCRISICSYDQIANGTRFTKQGIEKALPSLNYAPVIGYWSDEENDFLGHGQELVLTENGGIETRVHTIPYGVVIKDSTSWEKIQKPNGEYEEYLCADVYLWNRYEEQINKVVQNECNQSMEINIANGEYKDSYFEIQDFSFSALCILGKETKPAFRLSKIRTSDKFAEGKEEFKTQYSEMVEALSNYLDSQELHKYEQEQQTGGGEEMEEDSKETPIVEESVSVVEEDFSSDSEKAEDENNGKVSNSEEKEDFEEKYNSLNEQYTTLQEKYNALESEIVELRGYKEENEKAIRGAKEKEIFAKFEEIKDNEEFIALKEKSSDYSLEDLEIRCYAILGKSKIVTKIEQNKNVIFSSVDVNYQEEKHGKYDHLIEKYGKR